MRSTTGDLKTTTTVAAMAVTEAVYLVSTIDLNAMKKKLMIEYGWTTKRIEDAENLYRRFLVLCRLYPDRAIVPNRLVDDMWHHHILDTRAYAADTVRVFGEFLHHNPNTGLDDGADEQALRDNFADTAILYESVFGETIDGVEMTYTRNAAKSEQGPMTCTKMATCLKNATAGVRSN